MQEKFSIPGNHSVTGGGRVSVVFSEPLHGGSPKEWVTGLWELRDRFQGVSFLQLNSERCRPAFAEAASRRQAQGFSADRTGPSAHHFATLEWLLFLNSFKEGLGGWGVVFLLQSLSDFLKIHTVWLK